MNEVDNKITIIRKSSDAWSALIDLLDIAADELKKDGHEKLALKLEIESVVLARNAGLEE